MAADWSTIESLPQTPLLDLFANDPNRLASLSLDVAGIHFDWSKTHLTPEAVAAFAELAKASGLAAKRDALFGGEVVNVTEGRAVEHTAERGEGNPESVATARASHARMRALIDAIEAEALGPIRHVLHIGIGGSALGPDLLVDALGRDSDRYDVAIVSNVDGMALEEVFKRFDPAATLLVVASKTFTTTETMLNATSALQWMTEHGVEDPYGRIIALTANPDKAVEWGVDETRILSFAESVGGRYSLWSTIGFPAALGLGWDAFEELLEGAAEMDRHFRLTDLSQNAPALAAFADLYYTQVRHAETRAPFAYDERLRLLPSYLQQLEMESNGKGVTVDGQPVGRPTAAITWGGVGTDAQHAVFQLLHQGTHLVPVEFIAVVEPGDVLSDEHHRQLLLNAFAQGAALMKGKKTDDPARSYSGDRPSSTILLETLDPRTLGALIAFYEHRVFVNGVLLGINSFDQFGVELGKEMAKAADQGGQDFDPSTEDLIQRAFG
ncbi:phosphoglucose isomerase family protein [Sphingomonas sp. S17]|uniref:Glucose-6-phosphate isomerase n=2 Tax=Sphingomonas paucimobilis TaxID=13689 RepID=A0A411LIR5_SPHPI|nr:MULTISPECIES: glucose-6-phosphate isomerase [Sphingomonas]EGI54659.1 phosphoglucose isomerase family protein [Sphingomonas sp. S17]MBQ1478825.1 glucose-6-phosphate isomerase [Sphingomonas sp.]MCM3678317.1 glucose-6-phosphate isomerase [Sphingomonas paucimobilis]MDG5969305.1 glucose-6-phosphate isomerase [Sphingomonas paucimobilis]NNG57077.1 glucose-6-phosphate isomerase [Sphingomonas paucimobilis]